jgi:polyphosphate glucokinase
MARLAVKILVIDVGGTNVKVLVSGRRTSIKIPSGPRMTPRVMVKEVLAATADWEYDVISIGYPGPVERGHPAREPWNLGEGWVNFNFKKAFRCPVRMINDAAMQALGSYEGGRMLFLGLGTGLGSAMVVHKMLIPLELAHLPYAHGETYEDYLGEAGYRELGKRSWRRHVARIAAMFLEGFRVDYIVFGGGNSKQLDVLPPHTRLGKNSNAFKGGFRLWRV